MVASNASRNTFTRSGDRPGGAAHGRAIVWREKISLSASFSFGGIAMSSSSRLIIFSSGLFSGLPGTIAGLPDSPPLRMPSRLSA